MKCELEQWCRVAVGAAGVCDVRGCRYSVRYRAVLQPTSAGLHTMSVTHRESVKLWVDGVSLIDSASSGGTSVTVSGTINLPLTNA
jgi:hypothetical protein